MTGFASGTGCEPAGAETLPDGSHIQHAAGKISTFLNDGAPGSPEIRGGRELGKKPGEGFHVFRMENGIQFSFHIIRISGPLRIDIKHDKRIISVMQGDAFGGLQRVVQTVRDRCGWIDADTDKGMTAPCAEKITVFTVMIRDI